MKWWIFISFFSTVVFIDNFPPSLGKKTEKWWIFMYVCMCKAKSIIDGFFFGFFPMHPSLNDFYLLASKRSAPTCQAAFGFAPRLTAPGLVWNGSRKLFCISNGTCEGVKRPRAFPSTSLLTDYLSSPHACLKSACVMHSITIYYECFEEPFTPGPTGWTF